jgi:hypothetical protein
MSPAAWRSTLVVLLALYVPVAVLVFACEPSP